MRSPALVYLNHPYPWFGLTRCEQQERIMSVIDEEVDWSLLPIAPPKPVRLWINDTDARVMVLPGLTGGVEYHPDRVLRQLGYLQGLGYDHKLPEKLAKYKHGSNQDMQEINFHLTKGIDTERAKIPDIPDTTKKYRDWKRAYWPDLTKQPDVRGSRPIIQLKPKEESSGQKRKRL
jgi:hypothetical protein